MSGPFTTITVEEYYNMQDRIRALERALKKIYDGDPEGIYAGHIAKEALEALRKP